MPLLLGALAVAAAASMPALRHRGGETRASILVVGSVNADVIIEVDRLPVRDETVTSRHPNTGTVVTGGKGANQAVAAARLAGRSDFACCFGSDAAALEAELSESGVDMSASRHIADTGSGKGYVFLLADGSVSSVVVGGANAAWTHEDAQRVAALATSADVLLLQQEVPEAVNEEVAAVAAAASVAVFLDVGGEERPISDEMLRRVDFLTPNLTELARLTGMSVDTECEVTVAAENLPRTFPYPSHTLPLTCPLAPPPPRPPPPLPPPPFLTLPSSSSLPNPPSLTPPP